MYIAQKTINGATTFALIPFALVPFDQSSHMLYIQSALYLICSMTKHVICSIT